MIFDLINDYLQRHGDRNLNLARVSLSDRVDNDLKKKLFSVDMPFQSDIITVTSREVFQPIQMHNEFQWLALPSTSPWTIL